MNTVAKAPPIVPHERRQRSEIQDSARILVALRYWEDLSEANIAAVLGWPRGTVKSTLHRALKRLKKEIAR